VGGWHLATEYQVNFVNAISSSISSCGGSYFGRFIRKFAKVFKIAESQVIVEETMQGISIVKAFANEWYEIARYDGKNKEVVN
jgi:hypothetical protein